MHLYLTLMGFECYTSVSALAASTSKTLEFSSKVLLQYHSETSVPSFHALQVSWVKHLFHTHADSIGKILLTACS